VAKSRQEQLQEEWNTLNVDIQRLKSKLSEQPNYSIGEGDPAVHEWELNFALLRRLEERARVVQAALQKVLECGDTRCEDCGNPIEPERLAMFPEATLCATCARRRSAAKKIASRRM